MAWPNKVSATYFPNYYTSPPRIRDIQPNYNLIYLFSALPVGGSPDTTGAVSFKFTGDGQGAATHLAEDIQYAHAV